jgi:SnoaL-like polyketide cyclase
MNSVITQDTAYRALRALWSGASGDDLSTLFDDRFRFRNVSREHDDTGLAELRSRIASLRACNPDADMRVDGVVLSGDQVVFWWTFGDAGADTFAQAKVATAPALLTGTSLLLLSDDRIVEMCEIGGELVNEPCEAVQ